MTEKARPLAASNTAFTKVLAKYQRSKPRPKPLSRRRGGFFSFGIEEEEPYGLLTIAPQCVRAFDKKTRYAQGDNVGFKASKGVHDVKKHRESLRGRIWVEKTREHRECPRPSFGPSLLVLEDAQRPRYFSQSPLGYPEMLVIHFDTRNRTSTLDWWVLCSAVGSHEELRNRNQPREEVKPLFASNLRIRATAASYVTKWENKRVNSCCWARYYGPNQLFLPTATVPRAAAAETACPSWTQPVL
ncbi:hypothetical protein EI94DRAFT_1696637 [Lactarius quietus]|nr:hypothetical protein EI94DRAFT_1696637 [Lactarius quietus]